MKIQFLALILLASANAFAGVPSTNVIGQACTTYKAGTNTYIRKVTIFSDRVQLQILNLQGIGVGGLSGDLNPQDLQSDGRGNVTAFVYSMEEGGNSDGFQRDVKIQLTPTTMVYETNINRATRAITQQPEARVTCP